MRGNDLRGRGICDAVTLTKNKVLPLCFCFLSLSLAEDTYNEVFKRRGNIAVIIDDLSLGGSAALVSLAYGAAAAADSTLSFASFIEMSATERGRNRLLKSVIKNLRLMFRERSGEYSGNSSSDGTQSFPWDVYYRTALSLGMSEQEFWAATPRKIWLLVRDPKAEDLSGRLSDQYV